MQIIFTRHGESEANLLRVISNTNLPHALTERGRVQSQHLARQLAHYRATQLYASPIPRAQETAAIVGLALGLPVQTSDALREFHCGIMEGRGDEAAWQAHAAAEAAWAAGDHQYRIPGGDSYAELRARFVPFIEGLVRQYQHSNAVLALVSHGATLANMLPLVLTNIDRAYTRTHGLANCACVLAELRNDGLYCREWDVVHPE